MPPSKVLQRPLGGFGLGHRLWHDLEAAVPDVDRIDERNPANFCL
jgi:hypothetical protein